MARSDLVRIMSTGEYSAFSLIETENLMEPGFLLSKKLCSKEYLPFNKTQNISPARCWAGGSLSVT